MKGFFRGLPGALALVALLPGAGLASEAGPIDGAGLSLLWAVPFAGMLLSIAVTPLVAPSLWHRHFGKISTAWTAMVLVPAAAIFGIDRAVDALLHTVLLEYVPFLLLIGALFTVAGGILVRGNLHGDPKTNGILLVIGTLLASLMGTTGAAMLLVRPIIRANDGRLHNAHVLVFFIFLVANIGGALTPLGDPPLFLGFLKGVSFFWPTTHLFGPTLVAAVVVLAVFLVLDTILYRRDLAFRPVLDPTPDSAIRVEGLVNFGLLVAVVGAVLMSGLWHPGVHWDIRGSHLELQNVIRDLVLVAVALASLRLTPARIRKENQFSWAPIEEVAILFAGIFITMIPAIAILKAGLDGALAPVVGLVTDANGQPIDAAYFWLTGLLSSFLDNAPTYLVFFSTAGGNPVELMGDMARTLMAISAGAVFMGANSYIGNAPNFMVKSIAEERGIRMPSFFGYMAWSTTVLLPIFGLITWLFFL
ncbi:MAG: sodium:proton antiporter [Candidatus Binatia bacterium]